MSQCWSKRFDLWKFKNQTFLMFTKSLTKMELKKNAYHSLVTCKHVLPVHFQHRAKIFCARMNFMKAEAFLQHKKELQRVLRWRVLRDKVQQQVHSHTISPIEWKKQVPARSWRYPAVNCKLTCEMGTIYFTAGLVPHSAHNGVFICPTVSGNRKACESV